MPASMLLVLCLIDALFEKIPGLSLGIEIVTIYCSYGIIRRVWARMNAQDSSFTPSEFKGAEARMFGVSLIYGICAILWSLLLIAPGIWWGVRCSVAIVIAALQDTKPMDCLKRSEELVKGQFWQAFRYAFGGPALVLLGLIAGIVGIATLQGSFPENSQTYLIIDKGLAFFANVSASYWQLTLMPILVRLYAYLKWDKEVAPLNPGDNDSRHFFGEKAR